MSRAEDFADVATVYRTPDGVRELLGQGEAEISPDRESALLFKRAEREMRASGSTLIDALRKLEIEAGS